MRVLLVDDEPIALDRLETALSCIPEVEVVGRATSASQAMALKRENSPDVVLLDINMPRQNGLSLMESMRDSGGSVPEFIFVTALDQHALKAFELHAADYLLKPVAFERLREALRRAEARLRARTADERFAELDRLIQNLARDKKSAFETDLWIKTHRGVDRVSVDEISVFRADGDYVAVELNGRTHLLSDSLTALCGRLDPARFMRAHRSAIVNLSRVRGIRRRVRRGFSLVLESGEMIEVGPSYSNAVLERLHTRSWR